MSLSAFGTIPPGVLTTPVPFTYNVPQPQQDQLVKLIREAPIGVPSYYNTHTDTTNATASFGISRDWLISAQHTWASPDGDYNWDTEQAQLNKYPNFRINVNVAATEPGPSGSSSDESGQQPRSFDLHFAALFSRNAAATPVVLLHGWPGSWFEFAPLLDRLAARYTPDTLPYHVVVPSLPDYGLSARADELRRDLTLVEAAAAVDALMGALGFGERGYVAQGGDIGSIIAQILCSGFEACKALHVNFYILSPEQSAAVAGIPVTPTEQAQLDRAAAWVATGRAYAQEHGSRPSTISLALSTNPLAMLAWMGEKFIEWSDNRYPLSLQTILTMTSFYWFTNSFGRGMWGYNPGAGPITGFPFSVNKPFGYSSYFNEISTAFPRAWAKHLLPDLMFYKTHDKGGHFAALEQPDLFLQDLEEFVTLVAPKISGSR